MPRPETLDDIELDLVEIARFQVDAMGTNPDLLLGYAAFLKSMEKARALTEASYNTVTISRIKNPAEQYAQLKTAQNSWDESKKFYDQLASVGEVEYEYQRNQAKRWAEAEELPFPPEVEQIKPLDVVIRDIDEVVGS